MIDEDHKIEFEKYIKESDELAVKLDSFLEGSGLKACLRALLLQVEATIFLMSKEMPPGKYESFVHGLFDNFKHELLYNIKHTTQGIKND